MILVFGSQIPGYLKVIIAILKMDRIIQRWIKGTLSPDGEFHDRFFNIKSLLFTIIVYFVISEKYKIFLEKLR
jgi:hypothetical protein